MSLRHAKPSENRKNMEANWHLKYLTLHVQQVHSNSCSKLIRLNSHQEVNHFSVSNNHIEKCADRKRDGVGAQYSQGSEEQLIPTIPLFKTLSWRQMQ